MGLLRQTIRLFSILSFAVLLIGIPSFYFLLRATVKEEVDEELIMDRSAVIEKIKHLPAGTDISGAPFLDNRSKIFRGGDPLAPDVYFTYKRYDSVIHETVIMRSLTTNIVAGNVPYRLVLVTHMVDHDDLVEAVIVVQIVLLAIWLAGLLIINKKVSAAYLLQKEFTENAAHEMQTPLAVFQSKLELLMQTDPISEHQANLISKMANASQRLNKLNKALVTLTRIENHQFNDRESINLQTVIGNILEQYADFFSDRNINLSFMRHGQVTIEASRTLLEILVSNLLSNAIRHNIPGGFVRIIMNERELVVENSGVPRALDASRIFRRFYKESTDEQSTGLGLEMMQKICRINHYSLKYVYGNATHLFRIRF